MNFRFRVSEHSCIWTSKRSFHRMHYNLVSCISYH